MNTSRQRNYLREVSITEYIKKNNFKLSKGNIYQILTYYPIVTQ